MVRPRRTSFHRRGHGKTLYQKGGRELKRHQNPDGGWGECCESYVDTRLRLCGRSTPSQTAWVIMAFDRLRGWHGTWGGEGYRLVAQGAEEGRCLGRRGVYGNRFSQAFYDKIPQLPELLPLDG